MSELTHLEMLKAVYEALIPKKTKEKESTVSYFDSVANRNKIKRLKGRG